MCGIAGIAAFNGVSSPSIPQLKVMCDTIIHRGPDDDGMDIREDIAMGMRRLAIIDLKGGKQPIFNEDESVRTVFNGEIYNFRELRAVLEGKGHVFRTNTDTEVIVHAYEQYGAAFPKYLNGMFAIALHDSRQKKLILVRDHLGIKPLYYFFNSNHLVFGSEIKVLLASGLVPRNLDIGSLDEFIAWEYVPGDKTLFKEINKLKSGEMLEVNLQDPQCRPQIYWDVPSGHEITTLSEEEWFEKVDTKLQECVRRQLVSDVPLGAFLSGGVDSSLIVSAMGPAKTFSIGFDDPTYNELPWARKVAAHLNVDHVDEIITPDITELFEHLVYFLDDPIGDFSIFPTYLVSKMARQHVTVSLSGDGGDELFGGYETYLANAMARQYACAPQIIRDKIIAPCIQALRPRSAKKGLVNKAKRFLEGLEHPETLSHTRWRIFINKSGRASLFTQNAHDAMEKTPYQHIEKLFSKAAKRQPLNQSLYVDVKSYLCDNILVKVDRMSMAVSLESRVPFLDPELVEMAFQIPDHFKVAKGQTKVLLKHIAAKYIPKDCVYRRKEGFSIPIKNWLCNELRPVMEDLLSPLKLSSDGIFNNKTVERLKNEHLSGRKNHSHVLWSLMVFQAWKKRWLEV
ncbi:MAG: asparagine synthase (glutamine-hydrolyzing) [Desulfobulbaceae bacterium]|uniref:asparagine synthase (glutamine-hydrolyzing) n=1 Tax=Candidatus Desulfobia pelagia TaxID=2841692 RepID=A0A8J6TAB5_9BACT|nr:asparagine synthase (glutamine-hydrolyzing) [Candidatus Desulfobia pelagia]